MWLRNNASAKEKEANTYTVKRQTLTEMISLSGEIDAKEKAELKFQTSGLLTWVGVKEGDTVKKYQAIASLDKRELQNSLNQYLNSYMKERWDFEQAEADNKNWQTLGMTDTARDTIKRTLQQNQFDLNNSVLAVEAKNLTLKFATLTTPIAGIVTHVDVPQPGTNITPAGAVFNVINPQSLFFSATADQTEVVSFKVGQVGKIVLESFPDSEIDAAIESISFVPKEGETGTVYELKLTINGQQVGLDNLKMGMTGDANFLLKEKKDVLAVPDAYINEENGKFYVNKLTGQLSERTEVKVGESIEGSTEITQGLNEGDKIYYQP